MKECPICGSRTFDDAKTCFGCMHPFEGEEGLPGFLPDNENRADVDPTRFIVTFEPIMENGRTAWTCSVEQAVC